MIYLTFTLSPITAVWRLWKGVLNGIIIVECTVSPAYCIYLKYFIFDEMKSTKGLTSTQETTNPARLASYLAALAAVEPQVLPYLLAGLNRRRWWPAVKSGPRSSWAPVLDDPGPPDLEAYIWKAPFRMQQRRPMHWCRRGWRTVCSVAMLGKQTNKKSTCFNLEIHFWWITWRAKAQRTCAFCISVITRIVELLQQIGTEFIQRLDLFLLMKKISRWGVEQCKTLYSCKRCKTNEYIPFLNSRWIVVVWQQCLF